ncbi:MAG TPA: chain length determinant protein EpsF [Burkholderiales bacterium]|nr:chain length determinant protein EpsF [Burkholderiales bacterium]
MSFQRVLLILRARFKLLVAVLVATVAAAGIMCLVVPPRYSATTTLVIDMKATDPITGATVPAQLLMSNYMATELDIIQSRAVALKVVRALKLGEDARMKQLFQEQVDGKGSIEEWLAGGLLTKLDVKPSRESRMVDVIFTNTNPDVAAKVANAFADAYIQTNLDMKTVPAKDSAVWFNTQLKQLREQVENAQARLSRYQTEKGITTTDQRLDVESAKLAEVSSLYVQIQAQAYENASRQKQFDEFISQKRSIDSLPEVLSSPVIQDLKSRLSAAESRLSQASNTLGVNHPDYQRAKSEVDNLRGKLNEEVRTAAAVINNNLRVTQSRERELQSAVSAQKAKLLELNRNRDELGVLMKEVESAQHAYDTASQRHSETSLQSRMDQGSVVVLNPATPPIEPSFPKPLLTMALAVFVGLVLGIGSALLAEMLDRRVRGPEDLADIIDLPVWGMLEDTTPLSRVVDRKNRKTVKRGRFLRSLQEPTLG